MPGALILFFLMFASLDTALARTPMDIESGTTEQSIARLKRIEEWNESEFPTHFKQGHYEITARFINSVIDKGDTVEGEVYITGFGLIQAAKVNIVFSADIFQIEKSEYSTDVTAWTVPNDPLSLHIRFGAKKNIPSNLGFTYSTSPSGDFKKLFGMYPVRPNEHDLTIFTETWRRAPPVHLRLVTKEDTLPGIYYLDFFFTYFNGNSWEVSKHRAEFKIRNIFERNENAIRVVVIMASLYTALGFVRLLYLFYSFMRNRRNRRTAPLFSTPAPEDASILQSPKDTKPQEGIPSSTQSL
jgi:hypothetical protein